MNPQELILAILFHLAEPVSIDRLSKMLKKGSEEMEDAINSLATSLSNSGIRLLRHENKVELVTAPEASELITAITKEELTRDLTKAQLETLAIVLYKGPIARSEIDYIRGVNSTFILRNLLIRGLVEKLDNPSDQRSFLYAPTTDLLKFMGITNTSELPEYQNILSQLQSFGDAAENAEPVQKSEFGEAIDSELTKENENAIASETFANIEDTIDTNPNYQDNELSEEEHRYDGGT